MKQRIKKIKIEIPPLYINEIPILKEELRKIKMQKLKDKLKS